MSHVCSRAQALPGERMVAECTVDRQASGDSVMFCTMFCWKTSVPVIHVDVSLTPTRVLLKTTSAFNRNDTPAGYSGMKKQG